MEAAVRFESIKTKRQKAAYASQKKDPDARNAAPEFSAAEG